MPVSNAYLLAKFGFDTAENEPCKVCLLSAYRSPRCAIACARPVALKQCLGLPKPLWHEVMELSGGELAEISRIELVKRTDLEQDP